MTGNEIETKGLKVVNDAGETMFYLDGSRSALRLWSQDAKERAKLNANGNLWLGGNERSGDLFILPSTATEYKSDLATICLQGSTGDILLQNADCAEDFEVVGEDPVEPGTVMVIEEQNKLNQSTVAYDRRVAGVVSGAGAFRPGIVLGRRASVDKAIPIALAGKVFCKVIANHAPIEIGDLLTTSNVRGHAMKVTNPMQAFGAVIGKALTSHSRGKGLIPILVALQ